MILYEEGIVTDHKKVKGQSSRVVVSTRFLFLMVVLVGCNLNPSPPTPSDPFTFSHDPGTIVIYTDFINYPPREIFPGFQFRFRDHISVLRIWGDGKTILVSSPDGKREILTGMIDDDKFTEIFSSLNQYGIFGTVTPNFVRGSRYQLEINLAANQYGYAWNTLSDPLYEEIVAILKPHLTPYTPESARLYASVPVIGGWEMDPLFGNVQPQDWPQDFGVSLADVPRDGLEITGPILNYIWEEINSSPYQLRFREADQVYWVRLEGLREDLYVTPTPIPPPTEPYPYPIPPTDTPVPPSPSPSYPYP